MSAPIICESKNSGSRKDAQGPRYERRFTVIASSEYAAYDIIAAEPWNVYRGAIYQNHQGTTPDPYITCVDLSVSALAPAPRGGTGLYEVVANYRYPNVQYNQLSHGIGHITKWTEYGFESTPTHCDWQGNPIVNAVGEPPSTPAVIEWPRYIRCFQWVQRFQDVNAADAMYLPYVGKINSLQFCGAPPGCFRLVVYQPEETHRPGSSGWFSDEYRITMKFAHRPQITYPNQQIAAGWDYVAINRGNRVWKMGGTPAAWHRVRMLDPLDPLGQQYLRDEYLAADGKSFLAANTENPTAPPPGLNYIIAQMYPQADFNEILRLAGGGTAGA